jgi:serralysin
MSMLSFPICSTADVQERRRLLFLRRFEAVAADRVIWEKNELDVCFLDGENLLQQRVMATAADWSNHCSMQFRCVPGPDADIRISLNQGPINDSSLGRLARDVAPGLPTMRLGSVRPSSTDTELRRVVLHEFGHVLGLVHEFQNPDPAFQINWNVPAVNAYFGGPPYYWPPRKINAQILSRPQTQLHTLFDARSIMIYAVPPQLTNGMRIEWNHDISALDSSLVQQIYGPPRTPLG